MRNRPFNERGISLVDVLLAILIVGCVGFFAYKVTTSRSSKTSPANTPVAQVPTSRPVGGGPLTSNRATDYYQEISPENWKKVIATPQMQKAAVQSAPGCTDQSTDWGLPIVLPDVAKRARANQYLTVAAFSHAPCFKVGSEATIVFFDRDPKALVADIIGGVRIESIFSIAQAEIPDVFFASLSVDKNQFRKHLNRMRGGPVLPRETIVRLSEPSKMATPATLPFVIPRGRAITKEQFAAIKVARPEIVLLDVRNADEFAAGTLKGAQSAPFLKPGAVAPSFTYALRNSDVDKVSAHWRNESLRLMPIAVFGTNRNDPRPMWMAMELFDLGSYDIYWIIDGISGG